MQATPSAVASSAPTRRFEKVFSPPGMAVEMTSRTQCQVFIFEDYTAFSRTTLRPSRRSSQARLATELGTSQSHIARIERGTET